MHTLIKNRKNGSTGQVRSTTSTVLSTRSFPTLRSGRAGQAIFPLVLILTAVFGLIGVTFAGVAYLQTLLSSQRAFAEQALQASASGIDDALLRLARNSTFRHAGYTLDVDSVTATVIVANAVANACGTGSALNCVEIDSTATRRNVTRSLEVIVEISPSGATRVLLRQEVVN